MAEALVLFGGTFDPIHHGHLIVARALAEQFRFPRVTFVPAAAPPHKAGPSPGGGTTRRLTLPEASPEDRLAMIRLAIAGENLFDVSDLELRRKAPSYTIDTLEELRRQFGPEVRLHWIIGADALEDLPTWRRAEEVMDLADIITAVRLPHSHQTASVLERLSRHFSPPRLARLRAGLAATPAIDISSSQIRQRVREGRSIRYLTHEAVVGYIQQRGLYRALPGP
jgi:nicotinate-nucleotide adenylyltransferase